MSRTIHVCQSVEGALRNWSASEWKYLAKSNNMSVEDIKSEFFNYLKEGKEVIPIGKPCEGFDYKEGCPGHEN